MGYCYCDRHSSNPNARWAIAILGAVDVPERTNPPHHTHTRRATLYSQGRKLIIVFPDSLRHEERFCTLFRVFSRP